MPKNNRHIFFSLLLYGSISAFAQDAPPAVEDIDEDSTIIPVEMASSDTIFDLIKQQEPIIARSVPQKRVDSLKAAEEFWYANAVPVKKVQKQEKQTNRKIGLLQQQWFRDLLWTIVLCSFIGVVLWYLYSSNILIFRKKAKKILAEEDGQEVTDDIFGLPYDAEIAKAVEAKNFRLAIRLWYLQTLKELSEKGLIDYRFGRTNNDYVTQLYNGPLYRDFFRLTRNFEYTWYGQFEPSAEAYEMMRTDFIAFKTGLRQ